MKDFIKQVLAVIIGVIISSLFMGLMSLIMLFSFIAATDVKPVITEGSVLHIKLSGTIEERHQENPFDMFLGSTATSTQGLEDILTSIKTPAKSNDISGIYIEGGMVSADFASLEEIRKSLTDFKKTGKFILAYADNYTQGAYYVASAADSLLINPGGMLEWHGIASQPIFYKELLEKVGVKMQVFRVGTYKSAVEPFTRTDMSEANKDQVQSFISDIWSVVCKDVAASRKISVDSLNAYANRYSALVDAEEYVSNKLVDTTVYVDEVRETLRRLAETDKINLVSPNELAKMEEISTGADGSIAVYYAYGDIVGGEESGTLGMKDGIVGPKVVEDLDRLTNDERVKAVVLRINSGGGSAYAYEEILRAVKLLREKKPVVVSMGGMAASGGYYMACGADYIVAEPTTLTGSIGIFGLVPDASGLMTEKLGLHFDVVKTNEASDFGALGRPFNAGEAVAMQSYVERGYALFLKRVAEGRNMEVAAVDSIAQGRVWTGRQAMSLKLVDKLGTIEDAITEAAKRAKVKDYSILREPMPTDWMTQLTEAYSSDYMENRVNLLLGEYYKPLRFIKGQRGTDWLQARLPFAPNLN